VGKSARVVYILRVFAQADCLGTLKSDVLAPKAVLAYACTPLKGDTCDVCDAVFRFLL